MQVVDGKREIYSLSAIGEILWQNFLSALECIEGTNYVLAKRRHPK